MSSIPVKKKKVEKESALKVTMLERLGLGARELFIELGHYETRPQNIARRSGVASSTFTCTLLASSRGSLVLRRRRKMNN